MHVNLTKGECEMLTIKEEEKKDKIMMIFMLIIGSPILIPLFLMVFPAILFTLGLEKLSEYLIKRRK